MTREEQIESMADNYYEDCIIKSYDDFIAGARWADKTMLQEVLHWLEENFSEHEDFSFDFVEDTPYQCPVICDFESKEEMLQSFKERFNIVDGCDQQYPSDFINDR